MTDEAWRPLGVDDEDQIAEYDALHDGVPPWMDDAYWVWVRRAIRVLGSDAYGTARFEMLDVDLAEQMCQRLKIAFPDLRMQEPESFTAEMNLGRAIDMIRKGGNPLRVADYLLAFGCHANASDLDALLERSKSAYTVGARAGRPGLVRRVPVGVQEAADSVMARSQRAGVYLAKAWGKLYGLEPDASEAFRQAILAIEEAAVPIVSPTNKGASLGTVLRQIEDQKDWALPMDRVHPGAPTSDVIVGMMRVVWFGQHDRHAGQPSAPGNVSIEEATVAVSMAVTLVNLFTAGLMRRGNGPVAPPA